MGDRVDSWHMPVELCWNNVAHKIEKPVAAESREERIAWSEEFTLTYTDELCSPDVKLCVQEAVSALSTNVDKLTDIIVRALYGAAALGKISRDEVTASIRNLQRGKSAGPDKIISEMLKHANESVIDFFAQFFNKLYDEGIFPTEWSKSIIVPIHRKGDASIPNDYRGIALTSVLSKVYTHFFFNNRLTRWADQAETILDSANKLYSG